MDRESLLQFGYPIHIVTNADGIELAKFCLVSYNGTPIGAGLYHRRNKFVTAAIVMDEVLGVMLITHHDADHPLYDNEMRELQNIFDWAFP